jgi:hypothetical protein
MPQLPAGAAAAAIVAAAVSPALAASTAAGPSAMCGPDRGTVVAVDFGHWGGPVLLGCGIGADTGYALLHDGGFSTAGTAHDGPGFVCRLGSSKFRNGTQFPTPRQDPCVVTPPESAYWSFWTAGKGRDVWTYDRFGAMTDVPVTGGVEIWQFGAKGAQPTVTPDQLRARRPARASGASAPAPAGSSGSPTPVIAAGAIVVVLGGGAGWTVWRRRRAQS